MELTHIKYFLEVARTEHVTQSARNLCIVQTETNYNTACPNNPEPDYPLKDSEEVTTF